MGCPPVAVTTCPRRGWDRVSAEHSEGSPTRPVCYRVHRRCAPTGKIVISVSRTDLLRTSPKANVGACRTSSPQVGTWDGDVEGDYADTDILVPKKRKSRGHVAATPGYLLPSHEVGCHCCRDDDVGTGRAKCQGHGCRGRR
jgi:hypothetical protein